MSEDWKVGFKRAMVDALLKEGSPLDPLEDGWGWIHPDAEAIRKEMKFHAIDYRNTTWTDNWITANADSFNEGTRKEVIDVTVRFFSHDPVVFRYVGGVSDLISAVMQAAMDHES
jgi:hypothetical protein